jgi:hypothetical protein
MDKLLSILKGKEIFPPKEIGTYSRGEMESTWGQGGHGVEQTAGKGVSAMDDLGGKNQLTDQGGELGDANLTFGGQDNLDTGDQVPGTGLRDRNSQQRKVEDKPNEVDDGGRESLLG